MFFRGLPIRASRSPLWRAREEHLHHTVFHVEDLYIRNLFRPETSYTSSLFRPGTMYTKLAGWDLEHSCHEFSGLAFLIWGKGLFYFLWRYISNRNILRDKPHQTYTGTKKTKFSTSKCTKPAQGQKKSIYLGRVDYPSKVFIFLSFCPCAGLVHFEAQNFCFFGPCAGFRHGGGLQSAPNLHKDKKNKSFELQSAPYLHRDQKKTKKTKKNQSTGEESTIRLKFLFFCPCAGLVHFEVQNFFLFLCRFGALWSLQCWFFCPCAGFVHFQVQNPMHGYMCIVTLFPLFASYCASTCIFGFPCSFLKGQVHFSCKGLTIWR